VIGFALGIAWAHPTMDDRLATGAGAGCDIDELLSLARGFLDEHRTEEATRAVDRAAACGAEPSVLALYRALGPEGRTSLPLLDAAVAANPNHTGLRLVRSRRLAELGRTAEAALDARLALAAVERPQPDDVLWLAHLEADAPDTALATLDDAIARLGPAPALVREALRIELALGRPIAALGRLDGLPRTPDWLEARADILLRSGATGEATEVWTEALALVGARPTPAARARAEGLRDLLAAW
jgi:tetratricopeptide (TPR) repeat protein